VPCPHLLSALTPGLPPTMLSIFALEEANKVNHEAVYANHDRSYKHGQGRGLACKYNRGRPKHKQRYKGRPAPK